MRVLHLGPLHPVEQWLTLGLAFGPFLLLGAVVWWRRRQEASATRNGSATARPGSDTDPDR